MDNSLIDVRRADEKKGKLGCHSINNRLSPVINLTRGEDICYGSGLDKLSFRVGDKVIRTKNRQENILLRNDITEEQLIEIYGEDVAKAMERTYWRTSAKNTTFNDGPIAGEWLIHKCHLVNGDMGEIIHSHKIGNATHIIVKFNTPIRICDLSLVDAKVILAYSLTAHKCQGSGFNMVICPLTNFYWNPINNSGLFNRELVYTMFSRAIDKLVTVGKIKDLYKAIDRKTVGFRKTRLRDMMKNTTSVNM